jgi:glucose/arabinose dehydrogenase
MRYPPADRSTGRWGIGMRPQRARRWAAASCALLAVSACTADDSGGSEPSAAPASQPAASPSASGSAAPSIKPGAVPAVADTLAEDLTSPWGLAFLPDGTVLVTERDTARLKAIAGRRTSVLGTVPGVEPRGEGGLLGVAVSPQFGTDAAIFVYFTSNTDNRIVRFILRDGKISDPKPILTGIPSGGIHNGGRIIFGPDGMLYAGTGDSARRNLSQDKGSLGGKILRMTPEGKPAPGNPFPSSLVYSYGHRNVQGLAFGPGGQLWAAEFGQNTWDELNVIRPGGNYGWPTREGRGSGGSQLIDPVAQWGTAEASPSGIAIAGDAVYMAGLRGERLWRIPMEGLSAGTPRAFFTGQYGRLRTVEPRTDGSLLLVTSNTDGRVDPKPGDDRILVLRLQ